MKRFNIILNLILFSAGLFLVGTAILLAWRLPHGSSGQFMTFLGQDRHAWGAVHMWLGLAMVAGITIHLASHWRWIWRVASNQRRAPLSVVGIIALIVLGFFTFVPVEPAVGEGGRGRQLAAQRENAQPPGALEQRSARAIEQDQATLKQSGRTAFPQRGLRDGSGGGARLNQSEDAAFFGKDSGESERLGESWTKCPDDAGPYGGKGLGRMRHAVEESADSSAPQS